MPYIGFNVQNMYTFNIRLQIIKNHSIYYEDSVSE
jgi:hypothetical protein